MMSARQIGACFASIGLMAALGGACRPSDRTDSFRSTVRTPDGRELRAVSLPDLSEMTPATQEQIRGQYTQLTQKIEHGLTTPGDLGDAYGAMGKLLMAADYPAAAEACFLNAQMLVPNDVRWPYYLAHLYREQGESDNAVAFFERALELQPTDVASLVWLGDLHLARGQPELAEPLFAQALSRQPNSLSARFGLGRAALERREYERAVEYLEAVLSQDPGAAAAHYPLALAYRGLGETDKAERHLARREDHVILPADPLMVELDELLESPQAYESRGLRALDTEDWKTAAALFRKGLELDPSSPALRHRLGTALYMMGDLSAARQQFEQVVQANPDYHLAQYSLGVLLQTEARHREAVDRFSAALQSRPAYTEARVRLAASLRRTGRPKEALAHYEQVLEVDPNLTEARFGAAMAFVQLGRYREARDRLSAATKAYRDQSVYAHGLARLLAAAPDDRVRDGQQAMDLVQALIEKGRTIDLGETMAMALAELGRYGEAAALQRQLITAANGAGLGNILPRLTGNLALYERGEPCRTPWAEDELP